MLKEVTNYGVCAFCEGEKITLIKNFGEMGLAGGFLSESEISAETLYPMNLCFLRELLCSTNS